jgi:hypothetical protein
MRVALLLVFAVAVARVPARPHRPAAESDPLAALIADDDLGWTVAPRLVEVVPGRARLVVAITGLDAGAAPTIAADVQCGGTAPLQVALVAVAPGRYETEVAASGRCAVRLRGYVGGEHYGGAWTLDVAPR